MEEACRESSSLEIGREDLTYHTGDAFSKPKPFLFPLSLVDMTSISGQVTVRIHVALPDRNSEEERQTVGLKTL